MGAVFYPHGRTAKRVLLSYLIETGLFINKAGFPVKEKAPIYWMLLNNNFF